MGEQRHTELPLQVAAEEQELSPAVQAWQRTGSWIVAIVLTGALAWLTYTRSGWVPFLSGVDLGIHEFGHLLMAWAPRPVVAFAGSGLQVLVPACLAVYFWWRADRFAAILMLAWTGSSLNNVSVYIHDATRMMLLLWGDDGTGSGHDWRYLLGPEVFDALPATDVIAMAVRGFSALLFAIALGLAVLGFLGPRIGEIVEKRETERLAARRATLPVREPRNPVVSRTMPGSRHDGRPPD